MVLCNVQKVTKQPEMMHMASNREMCGYKEPFSMDVGELVCVGEGGCIKKHKGRANCV